MREMTLMRARERNCFATPLLKNASWNRRRAWSVGLALACLSGLAACGSDNSGGGSSTATPTTRAATPTRTSGATPPAPTATSTRVPTTAPTSAQGARVAGLVVVNQDVNARQGDVLGAPPRAWVDDTKNVNFDRALGYADWAIQGTELTGTTSEDGRFEITDLDAGGPYQLQVTKTLNGNLLNVAVPFRVGDDGATVVAEVSWGLVKSESTYTEDGVAVRTVYGPYGNWLVTRDGRLTELGTPGRTLTDADGDGTFTAEPCVQNVWSCANDMTCEDGRVCGCVAGCPGCEDCGGRACIAPTSATPYPCNDDKTCAQPGDRCVCMSSCPVCDDCAQQVCIPPCEAEITSITINVLPQIILGQQAYAQATAVLSDGSTIDVTALVDWTSTNESIATVDSWGLITSHALGTTTLTASLGDVTSAPITVEIVDRPTLTRIIVQNSQCYYPSGMPDVFDDAKPPVFAAPTANDLWLPSCSDVIQIGRTLQFSALGEFGGGQYYEDISDEVTWQSTPAEVGTLVDGLFTAVAAGTAQITAALGAVVSDAVQVRVVTEPTVVALSIYANQGFVPPLADGTTPGGRGNEIAEPCFDCGYTITVLRGDELQFHATATYDTGDWRDVSTEVAWSSSNPSAVTISAAGLASAAAAGESAITAALGTITSGAVTLRVVNQATLQSLYVYPEGTNRVVLKGSQLFFHASGYYDVGFERDVTQQATWHSGNDAVGGFDQPGVFTGRVAGTTTVWAELEGKSSEPLSLEVYETAEIQYCDAAHVNRGVWADDFNRVILESDCAEYTQPGVATLHYKVTETQPHGGIFDPCLDLYVYQGDTKIRTLREEGCGEPFLARGAPEFDAEVTKYELRAFWDLKTETGQAVEPGTYTIFGRFYLYYDPVVNIDITVR